MPTTRLRVLTNSELKTLRRCAFEHYLAYGLGYRSVREAEALRVGSLLHLGLEHYWRALALGNSPDALTSPIDAAIEAMRPHVVDEFDRARAEVMMLGYDARWSDSTYEVLAVEQEFTALLVNPSTGHASTKYQRGGKIDAIVRDPRDGRVYIVEHKTTSENIAAGEPYWQRLRLDAQVSTYYVGARRLGYDVAGCIYDVLVKPRIRPLLATPIDKRKYRKDNGALYADQRDHDETPDEFRARLVERVAGVFVTDKDTGEMALKEGTGPDAHYCRGDVIRSADDELDAAHDAWDLAQQLRLAERDGRHPRNPEACMRWGRPCDFFGVCTKTESLDDTQLFRRVEHVHEELSRSSV